MRKLILLIMIFSLIGCSSKKNTVMAPETSPEPIQNEAAQILRMCSRMKKEEEFEQQNSQPPKTSIKSENKQNSNTNNKQSAAGEETRHQLKQEVVETAQQEKSQTVQLKITADKQILDVAVEIKEG